MTARVHRNDVRRVGIGAITILIGAIIAWVGTTVQSGGPLPFKSYTTVEAYFNDVGTLKPQQKVTENGVRIGMVTDIAYESGVAHVTMRLDGNRPVYRDASARIGNESALGKKYIDFDPGTEDAGELAEGDAIPTSRTQDAADLDDVLSTFDKQARVGLADGLQALGGGFAGHGDDLNVTLGRAPELLDGAEQVVGTLAEPGTNLDDLLVVSDSLVAQFHGREDRLARLLDDAATTFEAVNVDSGGPIQESFVKLPGTLRTAREGLSSLNGPLATTARAAVRLRPGVTRLVEATPDLRGFLVESPPVARTVKDFTADLEPAVHELVPAVTDLGPVLTQRVPRFVGVADPFLTEMAPWWGDAGRLLANHNMLSGHFSPTKHYFSAMLAFPGLYNASVADPLADVDPYPGPGNAFGRSYE